MDRIEILTSIKLDPEYLESACHRFRLPKIDYDQTFDKRCKTYTAAVERARSSSHRELLGNVTSLLPAAYASWAELVHVADLLQLALLHHRYLDQHAQLARMDQIAEDGQRLVEQLAKFVPGKTVPAELRQIVDSYGVLANFALASHATSGQRDGAEVLTPVVLRLFSNVLFVELIGDTLRRDKAIAILDTALGFILDAIGIGAITALSALLARLREIDSRFSATADDELSRLELLAEALMVCSEGMGETIERFSTLITRVFSATELSKASAMHEGS